jgi:SAM-dependent methyltransferase
VALPERSPRALRRAVYAALRREGLFEPLRQEYLALLQGIGIGTENIRKRSQWAVYAYYCRLLEQFVPDRQARILDWGGHFGQVTQLLRTLGYADTVNYVHFRPESLDEFRPHHYARFRDRFGLPTIEAPDPYRLALDDASVDVAISSGVLEHVPEDGVGTEAGALAELHRVLRPGGLLFIWNLPTRWGTSELLAIALRRWHHRFRYVRREVVRLVTAAGFRIHYLDKHKLLPGTIADRLGRWLGPERLMRWDDAVSRCFPLSLLARDFGVVAEKPGA